MVTIPMRVRLRAPENFIPAANANARCDQKRDDHPFQKAKPRRDHHGRKQTFPACQRQHRDYQIIYCCVGDHGVLAVIDQELQHAATAAANIENDAEAYKDTDGQA